jgi:DNA polymerase-1
MLLSILRIEEPDALLFCFDAGEDTFRHQENATYKEGRAETPEEFFEQIPRIMEVVESFPFAHVSDPKYEADDFLCTYAHEGEKAGYRVTIVTGDRDALQLARENVRVAIPHSGYQKTEYLGPSDILAKYGVRPDQVPSYKGLIGDASDNLVGVRGIGPKTASVLLQQYGTLEEIYAHLDDIKPTVREKLLRDRDQAFFCERMATLVCDISLPTSLADIALQDITVDRARSLFYNLEFTSLAKRLETIVKTPYGQKHFRQLVETAPVQKSPAKADQQALF